MVQVGDIHVGRAETAKKPEADAGEVFLLWDMLVTRYDAIQITQIMQNFAHDPDLKFLLTRGLTRTLERQADKLEAQMNTLQIPLPERPPKSVKVPSTTGVFEDELIFKQIFSGIQNMLDSHVRALRSATTSDILRNMFIEFLKQELDIFNKLVVYGKMKGWLQVPPKYTS